MCASIYHRGRDILTDVIVTATLVTVLSLPPTTPAARHVPATAAPDFVKDIAPLLEARCLSCHGAAKTSGGYRLDNRAAALAPGDDGPRIVAGDSKQGLLLPNVRREGDIAMPPEGRGVPLTPAEVALLEAWINAGAPWPQGHELSDGGNRKHWAFRPIVLPTSLAPIASATTAATRAQFVRNPIDQFVLAGLKAQRLTPSPEADRRTLARRLYLDLLGLPPTPSAVDTFVADKRPDAYVRLVDELLASPDFGERWGRHWLDAARYADTNGFEKDNPRTIWPYRDWVVRAFNQDLPFERFAMAQLAGDLLPGATRDDHIATGFLRNSMLNEEGGVEPEQFRVEAVVDRVDAVGKAFLGLTINCAQCHDHKFDSLTQREYFQMFAFLNNDEDAGFEVLTDEQELARNKARATVDALLDQAWQSDPSLRERAWRWANDVAQRNEQQRKRTTVLSDAQVDGAFGVKLQRLADGSFLAGGDNHLQATYTVTATTSLTNITGVQLELLTHETLPYGGPGRSPNGSGVLTELTVQAAPAAHPDAKVFVPLLAASADLEPAGFEAALAIDGDNQTGWGPNAGAGRRNRDRRAVFRAATKFGFAGGTTLQIRLAQRLGDTKTIGRFRIALTTGPDPVADPLDAAAQAAVARGPNQRTAADHRALLNVFRLRDAGSATLNEAVERAYDGWPTGPATLALSQRSSARITRIMKRGDYRQPGAEVKAGVPEALHKFPEGAPLNRMGLARWLADQNNPLTPRVLVNRAWQALFGQGLVTTPEDLGSRAPMPSHPELLDWLAATFWQQGGRWKPLLRTIVTSGTYRQSSIATAQRFADDPDNVWLARGARFRVEAEVVRDVALASSGLLSRQIGGPSVFPPIADGVLDLAFGDGRKQWRDSVGEQRYRRALYVFWKRATPYPSLAVFDAPGADAACVRRARSNTPLQALTLLNDATFAEAAQALALRVQRETPANTAGVAARLAYLWKLVLGRAPTQAEAGQALAFVKKQRARFHNDTGAAVLVSSPDPVAPPRGTDLHALAPWTLLARALLNLDETITRE